MRSFFIIVLFSSFTFRFANAQTYPELGIAVDAGYTLMVNKHATHQGYIGGLLAISSDEKRLYHGRPIHQFAVGGGIHYGKYNRDKTETIPTLTLAYSYLQSPMPYTRVAISKYNVHPSVGFNFINILQIHVGYSIGYKRINEMRISGPTLSINLNLGINHMLDLSN